MNITDNAHNTSAVTLGRVMLCYADGGRDLIEFSFLTVKKRKKGRRETTTTQKERREKQHHSKEEEKSSTTQRRTGET